MCSGSRRELCPNLAMDGEIQDQQNGAFCESSVLLELAAADDLEGFRIAVESKGLGVDEASLWYGRRIGSRKMGFEERTPLTIASLFGSTKVLNYIVGSAKVDVNRACGSDGATPLHCAAAGGSDSSLEIVRLLIDASADVNSVDAKGNKPRKLIPRGLRSSNLRRKKLEMLLNGADPAEGDALSSVIDQNTTQMVEDRQTPSPQLGKEGGTEKKEYPVDATMPDINNGIYGTDEFRMYSFKVKPCSRAYSHDWTECPFVHPGENARRRDPRRFQYSCVPCPEFRKGTCTKGDACEYAHGVFESWLHPAQYKTRLCKDETGCSRKVCFFAHKSEELRPLYASTGSAMPSPKSYSSASAVDMSTLSPLALGSSSLLMPSTSTPPMSPSATCSSPMAGSLWQNKVNLTPPTLQLPGSRLKTAVSARDLELELLGLESLRTQQQQQQQRQQLIDELSGLSSPSSWNKEYGRIGELNLKPTNLDDVFGSLDSSLLPQLQSPSAHQIRQNVNPLRASYPSNLPSSPVRKPSVYGFETSGAVAAAVMNSRSAAFAKRSQSFVDRGAGTHWPGSLGLTAAANSASLMSSNSNLSDWISPDGKLDWGFQGEELGKLRKSASFGFRSNNAMPAKSAMASSNLDEPDVSWVNSLVKDVSTVGAGLYNSEQQKRGGSNEPLPQWIEQLYIEQEQMVA